VSAGKIFEKRSGQKTMTEYLWREVWSYATGDHRWARLPVVRKTRERVYVARHVFADGRREGWDALDRAELERTGKATTGTGWARRTYWALHRRP
jgi:hypothetical protein